jgi:hypothetical protein
MVYDLFVLIDILFLWYNFSVFKRGLKIETLIEAWYEIVKEVKASMDWKLLIHPLYIHQT